MNEIIDSLSSYLKNSIKNMSSYGERHLLKGDFKNIEEGMNSGTFVKLSKSRIFKSYLSIVPQLILFKKEIFQNSFIKKYKTICNKQYRLFNWELIIHSIVLKILSDNNILNGNICIIGDGKANFVHGILDLKNIKKIYSVNLPQALIQDYLVLKKNNSIKDNLIKVVENKKDLLDDTCRLFLVPAENKNLLENGKVNLFVNMFSFQEMPLHETRQYVNIASHNEAYLYSLNREKKIMYDNTKINYQDFKIGEKSKIIFENEATFARYFYNLKFPFIHRREKIIHTLAKF